jgi:hypothetical protein
LNRFWLTNAGVYYFYGAQCLSGRTKRLVYFATPVIAAEIAEDLQAALDQFTQIAADLRK